ncbi:hypothetical protein EON63_06825 [archaeon]|nr:MAG: hypothetical protein EON63_06825 [archaeon]
MRDKIRSSKYTIPYTTHLHTIHSATSTIYYVSHPYTIDTIFTSYLLPSRYMDISSCIQSILFSRQSRKMRRSGGGSKV